MKRSREKPLDAAELRCRAEKMLKASKKQEARPGTKEETRRLLHELQVHQIEMEMQNEELQQARAEVVAVLGQYTDLYDFAPVGYVTLDRDGTIRQANLTGARLLGVERSRLMNRRFGLFVSEDSRPAFNAFLQKVFEGQATKTCEVALRKEGNQPIWAHIEATVSEDGQECRAAVVDITERRRAEEETQGNLRRIRALRDIDLAITSSLDLRHILEVLLEKINLFLPYSAATIRLWNERTRLLEPVACRNINEEEWKADQWKGGRGSPNIAFEAKATISIANCQTDPRVRDHEFFRKNSLVSYVGVPLIVHDQILGVISFYTTTQHEFTSEEIGFLETLAGQAAVAINNSQIYEEVNASRKELELTNQYLDKSLRLLSGLYTALTPLAPSESVYEMMGGIIARLKGATGADAVLIRLWDDAKDAFAFISHRGYPDSYVKGLDNADLDGGANWVFRSGEPIISPNTAEDTRLRSKRQLQAGFHSCAMLPLKTENRVRGLVYLASNQLGYFDEEQKDHLMAIARQMGIALENREHFDNLKASRDELEKANKVKDEFLSVMSHELRTPLNVVVGYTGMIIDGLLGEVNEKQKEALEKVIRRTNDQLVLVNNILFATVLGSEKVNIESHDFNLEDFLNQLRLDYDAPINKDLSFNWDYTSGLPVIKTDSAKLKHILHNLIDNAIKFTGKGSVTISARVIKEAISDQPSAINNPQSAIRNSESAISQVEFKVADTGFGIPKDALPFIFDKFRQVDSSETRLFGGVGMGLYIVKRFAELLGGRVEVESEAGKGSTFTVTLPCES